MRDTLVWRDAATLEIEGRGWSESDSPYTRLPARAQTIVPGGVWSLSRHSAGLAVRFLSYSTEISVRWTLLSADLARSAAAA